MSCTKSKSALLLMMSLATMTACSGENFKGGGNRTEPPAPVLPPPTPAPNLHSVKLTCDGPNPSTNAFTSVQGVQADSLKIEGEFCPSVFAEMSILFVVDFSGSMSTNDPGSGGSCGRLQSAQAIINRISQSLKPQDKVSAGIVTFSSSAQTSVTMQPLSSFQSKLTSANFCGQSGATNYAAAFQTAQKAISAGTGAKTIYFISDGQPAVASAGRDQQAEQDGLAAAQTLKAANPNLTINAIYLQPTTNTDPSFDPQAYLAQITGTPDRVRLAASASTLAEEILKFALPVLEVVESTAKGILRIESSGTLGTVELASFARHPSKPGVWAYATKPFKPQGKKDTDVINQISIVAQDKTGKEQSANVVISYRQLD